jgi:IS30 family transposase
MLYRVQQVSAPLQYNEVMKYTHFQIEEREKIQKLLWQRVSLRQIAAILGRSHSSIVRELQRAHRRRTYCPRLAEERAQKKRRSRGREERLKDETIRAYVIAHLKMRWSPEQISGRMKKDGIGSISHEAIYQFIYAQVHRSGHGYLKPGHEDLRPYLRRKQNRRQKKGMRKSQRVLKPKGVSIDLRPKIVDERRRIGDWEGDTVESCDHKPGVNTILERKTGFFLVTKVEDKTSKATIDTIEKRMNGLPSRAKKTITFDNGTENSDWQRLEERTKMKTFFAHPYHSWERGANENANGLLRDYFPKKTDFTQVSDAEISKAEYALNTRPRKRLNWSTPLEVMRGALRG